MTLYGYKLILVQKQRWLDHYRWENVPGYIFSSEKQAREWLEYWVPLTEKEKYNYVYKDKLEDLIK